MTSFQIDTNKLFSYIDQFNSVKISVLGDIILDEYTWGTVDRVSPEAPIVVVNVKEENVKLGGAANVAHNMRKLGAEVHLFGVVGNDDAGNQVSSLLEGIGISDQGLVRDSSRPTTRKTRIIAHSQQVVRVDRENDDPIDSLVEQSLYKKFSELCPKVNSIVISDYKKGVVTSALPEVLVSLRSKGVTGMNKIPVIVDPKGTNYDCYQGASCVKPNKKEATQVSGIKIKTPDDAIRSANQIKEKNDFECVMVTLGEMGLVLVQNDTGSFKLDTIAQEVFDVSGAGDTVSAVFALCLSVGASPVEASVIANCAAARVIREVGTAAVEPDELKEVLSFWNTHQPFN
ncbi:MAG TPA: D-glycero-beta-D-manno-heptose-7-phosphate kinase [Oligoflexia bacterium]|nr:D-glycero-beta-D-manno-heptose-7-phosphate kinase [Oligoflexia bacterium]HMP47381.1 D-glycero-beta-D-manno-heptose-7-phosphate kinase [Oligoflexia bacterium]